VTDELESMWKEAVEVYFEVYGEFHYFPFVIPQLPSTKYSTEQNFMSWNILHIQANVCFKIVFFPFPFKVKNFPVVNGKIT
jgi:hypothetical protein